MIRLPGRNVKTIAIIYQEVSKFVFRTFRTIQVNLVRTAYYQNGLQESLGRGHDHAHWLASASIAARFLGIADRRMHWYVRLPFALA
jgi:hypothetical protein